MTAVVTTWSQYTVVVVIAVISLVVALIVVNKLILSESDVLACFLYCIR